MRYIFLFLSISLLTHAKQISTLKSGDISDPSIWFETPDLLQDTLIIESTDSVVIDSLIQFNVVIISGKLSNTITDEVSFESLLVNSSGEFLNINDGDISFHQLTNSGNCQFGQAKVTFTDGKIDSKNRSSFNKIKLEGNLVIHGEVEVNNEIITASDSVILSDSSKLSLSGTASEIADVVIDCRNQQNSITMNRASYQTLPRFHQSKNTTLHLLNQGNIFYTDSLALSSIYIDSNSTLNGNPDIIQADSILNLGTLHAEIKDSLSLLAFFQNSIFESYVGSRIEIATHTPFLLPNHNYHQLNINSSQPIIVKLASENYTFKNGIHLTGEIKFQANHAELNIRNNFSGSLAFIDTTSKVKLTKINQQSILLKNVDRLELDSCANLNFYRTFSAKSLNLKSSSINCSSFDVVLLQLDSASQIISNGSTVKVDSIQNHGLLGFSGNGEIRIRQLENSGLIKNETSDFEIIGNIQNEGEIIGGTSGAAEWKFKRDSISIRGNGSVAIPNLETDSTLINYSTIIIEEGLLGHGNIENYGKLNSKVSKIQTQLTINSHENANVIFSRSNFQEIPTMQFKNLFHLTINGPDVHLNDSIEIKGNLSIEPNASIDLNSFRLSGSTSSNLMLKDSSYIYIGDNEIEQSPIPLGFNSKNTFLSPSSTIHLKSKSNKTLPNWTYGNVIIDDGSVDSSSVSFVQDSLIIKGFLEIQESSITLNLNHQHICLEGDYLGPGHLKLNQSKWIHEGSNYNSGKALCEDCTYALKGANDQLMKNGNWEKVIINKTNGKAITNAHEDKFEADLVEVQTGEFAMGSEELHIDSLIIQGKVSIASARQDKFIQDIWIGPSGTLETDRNEALHIGGNLTNNGEINFSRGSLHFMNSNTQIQNNGLLAKVGEIITDSTLVLKGDFEFGSMYVKDTLELNQANIQLTRSELIGEEYITGDAASTLKTRIQIPANETTETITDHISVSTPFEQLFDFTIHFQPSNNLIDEIDKGYKIKALTSPSYHVQVSPPINHNAFLSLAGLNEFQSVDSSFTIFESEANIKFAKNNLAPLSIHNLNIEYANQKVKVDFVGENISKAFWINISTGDTSIFFNQFPSEFSFYESGDYYLIAEMENGKMLKSNIISIQEFESHPLKIDFSKVYPSVKLYTITGQYLGNVIWKKPSEITFPNSGFYILEVALEHGIIREKYLAH